MKDFEFSLPTRIHFGCSCLDALEEEVLKYGKRVMLVYGKESIKKYGIYQDVVSRLAGCEVIIDHGGVQPNPLMSHDHEGIRKAIENQIDVIIGIGGGSAMDSAKAIAVGVKCGGDLWKLQTGERNITGALPVIAVCTVPATSSESNIWFVFTNDENHYKVGLGSELARPKAAFLNPQFTLTLPPEYTALAAVDIISHMTEAYFTTLEDYMPVNFGMIEGISRALMNNTKRIMENPKDLEARTAFMWAAALAFNGLTACGFGPTAFLAHKTGHPLSSCYGIAHGASLSIMTPAVLRYHKKRFEKRLAAYGRNVWGISEAEDAAAADACIESLCGWYREIGAPMRFSEAGIEDPDIDLLAGQVMDVSGALFRDRDEVVALYEMCR